MNWKTWIAQAAGVLWIVSVTMFLIVAGWLLHVIEVVSRGVVKNKKAFNKKAVGAGTVAALVAKPVNRYAQKGRMSIRRCLAGHYRYGVYISRIV